MATRFSLHLLLVALTLCTTLLRPISASTTTPHSSSPNVPPPHSPSKPTSLQPQPPPPKPTSPPPPNPSSPPPPKPSSSPPPPPPLPTLLETIVSALLSTGDFRHWATLLTADPSTLPPLTTATLFIPSDQALSHFSPTTTTSPLSFDPFLIPYHIIPQRLPFSDLQLFQTLTRLPTLLPANSILITKNFQSNFSVDGSQITHPDLYVNSAIAVHGVANVLDYSVYGGGGRVSPPPPLARKSPEMSPCCGRRSGAAGWGGDEFTIVFVVVCAAFAFKI